MEKAIGCRFNEVLISQGKEEAAYFGITFETYLNIAFAAVIKNRPLVEEECNRARERQSGNSAISKKEKFFERHKDMFNYESLGDTPPDAIIKRTRRAIDYYISSCVNEGKDFFYSEYLTNKKEPTYLFAKESIYFRLKASQTGYICVKRKMPGYDIKTTVYTNPNK